MKKTNLLRTFAKYVSFNVISMVGLSLYILADTFFIANGVGADGLTALNLVLPIYSFMTGIGMMLGMGGAVRYSQKMGENSCDKAKETFTLTIILSIIVGFLLMIVGLSVQSPLLSLLGANGEIKSLAMTYLKTIFAFAPAFILNSVMICFVRNDSNPNLTMAAMLAGSFSNIILDYIFVYPLGMGMFGAAFATCLAPVISLVILSFHWIGKSAKGLFFASLSWGKNTKIVKILSTGLPSFITEFSSGIIILAFNFTILSLAGTTGVAAYGIVANLALVATSFFTGIAQGIQPLLSSNYGAGNIKQTYKVYGMAIILSVFTGLLFCIIGLTLYSPIVSAFNQENDPLLAQLASEGIQRYFPAFLIMGVNIVTTSFLTAISYAKKSFFISLSRGLILILVFVLILPQFFGMTGVWISVFCTELFTLFLSYHSVRTIINPQKVLHKIKTLLFTKKLPK